MKHPGERLLALWSGGDLPAWRAWMVKRHVAGCEACRREVDAYRRASQVAREMAELPAELAWDRLAAEMKANIHLGLVAGAIAAEQTKGRVRWGWRAAIAVAIFTLAVVSGWLAPFPLSKTVRKPPVVAGETALDPGIFAEATPAGIELKGNGGTLAVVGRSTTVVTVSAKSSGSVGARFVDSDTGQVTIANVYME